jgi:hypothetical protein
MRFFQRTLPGFAAPPFLCLLAVLLVSRASAGDSTVVFNEIMYHPARSESALEWIELHNQMAVDMDLSGWALTDGVTFEFPPGTILNGGGYLVVAVNPTALQGNSSATNVFGPFAGRLSNAGERIELRNRNGRLMDSVRYRTDERWPAAPDGGGVSLAKRDPIFGSANARNWMPSAQMGGTPSRPNFPTPIAEAALAFNELSGATAFPFWIEIRNRASIPTSLKGVVVQSRGNVDAEFTFSSDTLLAPDAFVLIDETQLGFRPRAGDKLFLLPTERNSVLDAVVIAPAARGRHERTGEWLVPAKATPGGANEFLLHDEIVINEIMYHQRALAEQPATFENTTLVAIDARWKFDQSGNDLGTTWRQATFNDDPWPSGPALLFVENAALPAPKNTPLTLGRNTYYFRTRFVFDGSTNGLVLQIHPMVDDGAVFYLNGAEVFRLNMPEGPVDYNTPAAQPGIGDATFAGPFTISATNLVRGTNVLAVEVHQVSSSSSDIVFGAELFAQVQTRPAIPYQESPESWIELFNRSANEIDLSGWQLADGIEFTFPAGTKIAGNGFLVIAKDTDHMRAFYPELPLLGNFTNNLSKRGEIIRLLDAMGNPADELEYFDGKPWPEHADGGGSSLELRDPDADNSSPEAWASSDESVKSEWKTYSYREIARANIGPTRWNEFVAGLLDAGEVLLDDLSVIESPGTASARELLQNGSFENGLAFWRAIGNHKTSAVIVDPGNPNNRVLHQTATGPTEHMHNHVETTLINNVAVVNGREYEVSFRAKWLAGSPQLHTRLYFNRAPRTTLLQTPALSGTPGRRNSRSIENLGPTFSQLQHRPTVPSPNQTVTVSACITDPDGMSRCTLWWSANGGTWTAASMSLDTSAKDRPLYSGTIPGRAASALVQFYIEAEDGLGAVSFNPAGGRASRALYRVNDNQANLTRLHNLRILMTATDAAAMHAATNVMSNGDWGATIIHDEREVFYDAGIHLQSSQRGRNDESRVGFTIHFPAGQRFRGVHDSITLDRSGGYSGRGGRQDEIVLRHVMNQAGGLPDMYNDIARVIYPRPLAATAAGTAQLLMAKHDDEFLDGAYPNGSEGTLFKLELIYFPTTSVGNNPQAPKLPQPDDVLGTDFVDLGQDKEVYRWNFLIENNRAKDDYAPLMQLAKTLSLTGAALDTAARQQMDVDQWMRVFALKSLSGDVDTYGFGYPHNLMIYFRPEDGRAVCFPWDMDFSWTRSPTDSLLPSYNIAKVINFPAHRRLFYGHLLDIVTTTFNNSSMARWTTHYGSLAGQNYSGVLNYIVQRGNFVKSQMPPKVNFSIATGASQNGLVQTPFVNLSGAAWIDVKEIRLASSPAPLTVAWSTWTNWQTSVPVILGTNKLEFYALDFQGKIVATNVVLVTSSASGGAPDSDGDGMPDLWERNAGLNEQLPDADFDFDQDGFTNRDEYFSGTDPWDSSSALRVIWTAAENGRMQLRLMAMAGRSYAIEYRNALNAGAWQILTNIPPTATVRMIEHADTPSQNRFYRLRTPAF